MFALYILSLICFLLLWWAYFGYFIFLAIARLCHERPPRVDALSSYPTIAILVCCKNEEALATWKVENLAALDYPIDKLEVIFLDGSSTDDTVTRLERATAELPYMRVVQTGLSGKIPQLNSILPSLTAEFVVNTDMDAELQEDVLIELVKEFQSDASVAVSGALVEPKDTCPEEVQYWRSQNQVRILESEVYSSSIVIAPCYMFERDLVREFPEDVVADDIYIAYAAISSGRRVTYCKEAFVYETRTPQNWKEVFHHKFRKTNAYITEVLRFMHRLPQLNLFWRIIYITRALQLFGTVWILLLFSLVLLSLISFGKFGLVLCYFLIGVASLGLTHMVIGQVETDAKEKVGDFLVSLRVFVTITALLLLAALTYPFYRQSSSYQRLQAGNGAAARDDFDPQSTQIN